MTFPPKTFLNLDSSALDFPGADYSFLKQLSSHSSQNTEKDLLVQLIERVIATTPQHIHQRWLELLHNLSNSPIFQGIAEIASYNHLQQQGWNAVRWNKSALLLQNNAGQELQLVTIAFILQRDQEQEQELQIQLCNAINQIATPHKVGMVLRQPLSPLSDFEQIAHRLKSWLKNPTSPGTKKRKGNPPKTTYFKDHHNWIEFHLLTQTFSNPDVVIFVQQPLMGRRLQRIIDSTADSTLEGLRQRNQHQKPVILSIVGNQSFQMTNQTWQSFLYGPPSCTSQKQFAIDTEQLRGWFQDPFRTFLHAVLKMEQNTLHSFTNSTFINPWCEFDTSQFPTPSPSLFAKEFQNRICLEWK